MKHDSTQVCSRKIESAHETELFPIQPCVAHLSRQLQQTVVVIRELVSANWGAWSTGLADNCRA